MSTDTPSARRIEQFVTIAPVALMLVPALIGSAAYFVSGASSRWFVVAMVPVQLGVVVFAAVITRKRREAKRHLVQLRGKACPECGYPLEFIGARCSECGAQTSPERARDRWARAVGRLDDLPWDRMDNDGSGLPERSDKS